MSFYDGCFVMFDEQKFESNGDIFWKIIGSGFFLITLTIILAEMLK